MWDSKWDRQWVRLKFSLTDATEHDLGLPPLDLVIRVISQYYGIISDECEAWFSYRWYARNILIKADGAVLYVGPIDRIRGCAGG